MKVKTKLRLGFGFLFLLVISFGAIALFYINQISGSAKVILKDNYKTLQYTRAMRAILDDAALPLPADQARLFDQQLMLEEHNLTEPGEKEAGASLRKSFDQITDPATDFTSKQMAVHNARLHLRKIEDLNMDAIVRKNDAARHSVERATIALGLTAAFCFLVLFSFSVNFPGFIADPLRELAEGIREIGQKNYKQRLEFKGNDEFTGLADAFNQMAARLNAWENSNLAKLRSEKMRIEAIIEQMQDGIIGISEQQEILFINTAAQQLLGLYKNSIGRNVAELVLKNDLLKSMVENKMADKPYKIYADGKESYFQLDSREISIPNFDDQEGETLITSTKSAGQVFMLRNITRFKELDEAKTHFIATVSHELKTPISSVKMSLKLLNDERVGNLNTEQQQLLANIEEDNERLLKITSELLNLSQAETGNLQLNFLPAEPEQITAYAIQSVKFQAEQKDVRLELISGPQLPKVNADVEKTAWVLINFLSNALRYSPEKSKVLIQVVQNGRWVEFSVRDFGKGIDPQYQKHLFDRYFQVPADGKNRSGSGLGLAISKDFIEAQNGKIWVESIIGEGSRFCFSLPEA